MKKKLNHTFKGLSLFASAGIAEMDLAKCNISIKVANELLSVRSEAHKFWHPNADMICGDITNEDIKSDIINKSILSEVDFILATPPCQGVSLIGKNKSNDDMINDPRNFLIFHAFDIIDKIKPKVIVIENVPRFLKMDFPYKNGFSNLESILRDKYDKEYNINVNIYNAQDYGVPQSRQRAIIVLYKPDFIFELPKKQKPITVREAISHLPSIEAGEKSSVKNHYAREHSKEHILCMQHTPSGHSAFENAVFFPKKTNGERAKGYAASYKRIDWDKPAPTITMRNDCISSQSNVHPGRLLANGLYSDARVLTLRELFILSSINPDIDIPPKISDIQIRHMIGEAIPPRLLEAVCSCIKIK